MSRDIELIKRDLEQLPPSHFITKWIFDHTPFVFDGQEYEYIKWREELAKKLNIDPTDILITGSASLGFSLNPNKNFKLFNESSDIDVSIISQHYFDIAWHDLLHNNSPIHNAKIREARDDHRSRLIYWGTIATDKVLPLLSFGRQWDKILNECKTLPILEGREINFRIYKNRLAARNYISISIKDRKEALMEAKLK